MIHRTACLTAAGVVSAWIVAGTGVARAADVKDYAGIWFITGSTAAPWADPTHPARSPESRRLTGKRVVFLPQRVVGPSPLGCVKPVYKIEFVGPDMIFEGMLAEPRNASPGGPAAALANASALGFPDPMRIKTLDVGCSEVHFHSFHRRAIVFGLNNRVYTLTHRK